MSPSRIIVNALPQQLLIFLMLLALQKDGKRHELISEKE